MALQEELCISAQAPAFGGAQITISAPASFPLDAFIVILLQFLRLSCILYGKFKKCCCDRSLLTLISNTAICTIVDQAQSRSAPRQSWHLCWNGIPTVKISWILKARHGNFLCVSRMHQIFCLHSALLALQCLILSFNLNTCFSKFSAINKWRPLIPIDLVMIVNLNGD